MHTKRGIGLFLLLYSCLLLFSCSKSTTELVQEYERAIANIEAQHTQYSKRDWIDADRKIAALHTMLKRKEHELSREEKKRIYAAFRLYQAYRGDVTYPFAFKEQDTAVTDSETTVEPQRTPERQPRRTTERHPKKTEQTVQPPQIEADDDHTPDPRIPIEPEDTATDTFDTSVEKLEQITRQQKEISSQLEQLRQQIEITRQTRVSDPAASREKTEQERLIASMQKDLLMDILKTKKQGWRDVSGAVKILIFPARYKGHRFTMDYTNLSGTIQNAVDIILSQARRYNQRLSIDWEFMTEPDGSYPSLTSAADGLDQYARYKNRFSGYNQVSVVYAVDMTGRSYCSYRGTLGKSTANAVVWFKDSYEHSAGTLAHELFHTFGADDLYYEEGIVPQEVEANFKKLLGDSIMLTARGSSGLDPINAWLIGWNKNPEPWYAWFIDRREPVDVNRFE